MPSNGDLAVYAVSEASAGYSLLSDLFPNYEYKVSLSCDERDQLAASFEPLLAQFTSSFAPNPLCMRAASSFSSQPSPHNMAKLDP